MPERGSVRGMRRTERHKCGASGIGNTCLPRVEAWEQHSRARSRNYAVPSFQCQSAVGRPPFCEITWLSDLPQLPLAPASFVPLGADPGCAHPPPPPRQLHWRGHGRLGNASLAYTFAVAFLLVSLACTRLRPGTMSVICLSASLSPTMSRRLAG